MKAFGSKELVRCLGKLGFKFNRQNSSHAIFNPPVGKNSPDKPFMTVQLGRKTFDPYSANRYTSQIKRFGFTKEEIEKHIK